MEILTLFSLFLSIIFSITHRVLCVETCELTSCSPTGPTVRFPFRLGRQPRQCGYPGFDLSCNNQSQLLLNIPFTGNLVVTDINYTSQTILFKPKFCPPPRLDTFSPFGSPFDFGLLDEYFFINCSSTWYFPGSSSVDVVDKDCVGNVNGTVVAFPGRFFNGFKDGGLPENCTNILLATDIPVGFRWNAPFCGRCERDNGTCGYKNVETLEVGCSVTSKGGLSAGAKYGITIGAGLPGLFLLVCLSIYARKKINDRALIQQRHHVSDFPTTIALQPPRFAMGLDKLTIDSYPMTVLGESKRLPKPSDSTCAICLSEYQPNDTLRTVPECNHYFHSNCIDEWLKLNATCPICRNFPEGSLDRAAPPLSSSSSSTSLFSS
ncbi:RING-H2 finger protein ATL20-like [Daucus carota subsp. sativus]|uniref:RING-H2 finger protein ATL20-like n=1 Tax=Daucus carota subsp. sativus TaxID=79200 RepID=UPI0007EF00E5|nr:PREDICTED: RING-H2 finger protein ATL20-like isoform X1 [Daucus carota subsp. sativus]XP_017228322.1 PREDICTED: RING-H2 finger protein ATL20-like isoform X1 [Daucus carota subsp. sativus]